ncbi:CENP-B protein, partial [Wolfiporia cocos MD-104 SS10]
MSPNGWTDNFLCTDWFAKSFIPQAQAHNATGAPILLIYDGHGSHTTKEMVKLAIANNIHLFCLPPHTTHKLQPLDIGVFGPLQRKWQGHCDDVLNETGEEIHRQEFVREYMSAREASVRPELVQSAFQRCGIAPFNPN